jgi:hypothetical protein
MKETVVRRIFLVLAVTAGALALAGPVQAAAKAEACAAYEYSNGNSLCSDHPGSADRNCPDIKHQVKVVSVGTDPWALDRDRDGRACESYPAGGGKPAATSTPAPTTTQPAPNPTSSTSKAGLTGSVDDPGSALPKTGPRPLLLTSVGLAIVLAGMLIAVATRRRRMRFQA